VKRRGGVSVHPDRFPCKCENNDHDSLDVRRFPSVVLAVAPAVTIDEASSLLWYLWSESLCSHSQTVYIQRGHEHTRTGNWSESGFGTLRGAPLNISRCLEGGVDTATLWPPYIHTGNISTAIHLKDRCEEPRRAGGENDGAHGSSYIQLETHLRAIKRGRNQIYTSKCV